MICMIWKQYQTKEGAFIIELLKKKLKYKTKKKVILCTYFREVK